MPEPSYTSTLTSASAPCSRTNGIPMPATDLSYKPDFHMNTSYVPRFGHCGSFLHLHDYRSDVEHTNRSMRWSRGADPRPRRIAAPSTNTNVTSKHGTRARTDGTSYDATLTYLRSTADRAIVPYVRIRRNFTGFFEPLGHPPYAWRVPGLPIRKTRDSRFQRHGEHQRFRPRPPETLASSPMADTRPLQWQHPERLRLSLAAMWRTPDLQTSPPQDFLFQLLKLVDRRLELSSANHNSSLRRLSDLSCLRLTRRY